MIGFASLGSGSRGNATLVVFDETVLLIDCGFTVKQVEARLPRFGLHPSDIDAVLVTHEHADHASGVAALAHKYGLPVYASHGTLAQGRRQHGLFGRAFDGDAVFRLHGVDVNPVRVPHDAREPTQFVLSNGAARIGVLSDLGHVTPHVITQFSECDAVLLEANHDVDMLIRGSYPPKVKRRIGSEMGHLANEQAAALLQRIAHPELKVVIGHISEENNSALKLEAAFGNVGVAELTFANQAEGVAWTVVSGATEELPSAQASMV